MSTFIFVSPDFPQINVDLCVHLADAGVRVLGIGDAEFDGLDPRLKDKLSEYYEVGTLDDYSEVYRAVALFAHKYGKPDHIDSNNSHWLSQDAALRRDFNVPGITWSASDRDSLAIVAEAGLSAGEAAGQVFSWDAIIGSDRSVLFEGVTKWPAVSALDYAYRTVHTMPDDVVKLGRAAAGALRAKMTFLHVQVAFPPGAAPRIVRVSRSAPPAFTLDMHNYAGDIDTYQIYAAEIASLDPLLSVDRPAFTPANRIAVYASRQDDVDYRHPAAEIDERWHDRIRLVARNPQQYRRGMGDTYFIAVADTDEEADAFTADVTERA